MGGGDPSTSAKVGGRGTLLLRLRSGGRGTLLLRLRSGGRGTLLLRVRSGGRGTLVLRVRSGGRGTRRLLTSLLLRLGATRTRGGAGTSTAEGQGEDAEGTGEGARALPPSHSSPPNHPTRALRTLLQPSWMRVDESWTNSHPTHPTLIKRSPNSSPPFVKRPPTLIKRHPTLIKRSDPPSVKTLDRHVITDQNSGKSPPAPALDLKLRRRSDRGGGGDFPAF